MTRSQKRRRQLQHRNLTVAAFVLAICLIFIGGFHRFSLRTSAASEHEMYLYYTSVTVRSGDTLWSIADEYHTVECGDMQTYIMEIQRLNHLGTDEIHAGSSLVIPYYTAEVL